MGRPERPLDAGNGPVEAFAAELRRLRECAGRPTYRDLGRSAHYAGATLARAASGGSLPTLEVTLAYVRACGGDAEEWTKRWQETERRVRAMRGDGVTPVDSPS